MSLFLLGVVALVAVILAFGWFLRLVRSQERDNRSDPSGGFIRHRDALLETVSQQERLTMVTGPGLADEPCKPGFVHYSGQARCSICRKEIMLPDNEDGEPGTGLELREPTDVELAEEEEREARVMARAMQLVAQHAQELEAFRRAASPEGGDIVPSMEAGGTHWRAQDEKTGAYAAAYEQYNAARGYVSEPGQLAVGSYFDTVFKELRYRVVDARTGEPGAGPSFATHEECQEYIDDGTPDEHATMVDVVPDEAPHPPDVPE